MNSYIVDIIEEMFKHAGVNHRKLDFLDFDFSYVVWDEGTENQFIDYLTLRLARENKLQKVFDMEDSSLSACRHMAKCFLLVYGFKVKTHERNSKF